MRILARTLAVLLFVLFGCLGGDIPSNHLAGADRPLRGSFRGASPARMKSIAEAWSANASAERLSDLGRGKGIVFSPDLSEPGNREFYHALGFAYFEDPDWRSVLNQLKAYNQSHPESPVEVLLIQSHGTNGDALKLQKGSHPDAPRSYISPGALLERLEGTGVHVCLLAACNAGRLFRPENLYSVRVEDGNHLFGPATLGIINASPNFDPLQSKITVARRAESHIELINECHVSEFAPSARAVLAENGTGLKDSGRIAVPEMLIQLLLNDERLHLVSEGFEVEKSKAETSDKYRERLISRFLRFVDTAAARERQTATSSSPVD